MEFTEQELAFLQALIASFESPYDFPGTEYSEKQLRIMNALYYVTPPLSLLGSVTIVYAVLKGKLASSRHFKPTFVRILLGYSFIDIIHTVGYLVLGPWAVPEGIRWVYNAQGTRTTCDIKGFFFHMVLGMWIYSASLAFYFALKIGFGCRDSFLEKRFEPVVHTCAWVFPVVSGMVLTTMGYMNPLASVPGYCWIFALPTGCVKFDLFDCDRGEQWYIANLICSVGLSCLCCLMIAFSFVFLYCRVRANETRLARYDQTQSSSASRLLMTRSTRRQAFCYIGTFVLSNVTIYANWCLPSAISLANPNATHQYFCLTVAHLILFPLQGFLHCCIFLRSHPILYRDQGPLAFLSWGNAWLSSLQNMSPEHSPGELGAASSSSSTNCENVETEHPKESDGKRGESPDTEEPTNNTMSASS